MKKTLKGYKEKVKNLFIFGVFFLAVYACFAVPRPELEVFSIVRVLHDTAQIRIYFSLPYSLPERENIEIYVPGQNLPLVFSSRDCFRIKKNRNYYCLNLALDEPILPGVYSLRVYGKNKQYISRSVLWGPRSMEVPEQVEFKNNYLSWKTADNAMSYSVIFFDQKNKRLFQSQVISKDSDICRYILSGKYFQIGHIYKFKIRVYDAWNKNIENLENGAAGNWIESKYFTFKYRKGSSEIIKAIVRQNTAVDFIGQNIFFAECFLIASPLEQIKKAFLKDRYGVRHDLKYKKADGIYKTKVWGKALQGKGQLRVLFKQPKMTRTIDVQLATPPEEFFYDLSYDSRKGKITWLAVPGVSNYKIVLKLEDDLGRQKLWAVVMRETTALNIKQLGAVAGMNLCAQVYGLKESKSNEYSSQVANLSEKIYFKIL